MLTTEQAGQTALETMIERFRTVLASSPENPTVLLGFAEANLRRGRRLEALQAYQKVLGLTPDVSDAHLAVAEIYRLHGLPLEAYDELRRVFELEPGRPEAHLLLHEIEGLAPIPPELDFMRRRYPSELQVAETRSRLVLELEHLVREVEQLREPGEGPTAEPVSAYHLEQARKRLSRTQHLLSLLDTLPTHSPEPPRPELLAPVADEEPVPELPLVNLEMESEAGSESDSGLEPVAYETPEFPELPELPELTSLETEPAYETQEMDAEPDPLEDDLSSLDDLLRDTPELDGTEPEADAQDIEEFFSSLAISEENLVPEPEEVPLPVLEPEPEVASGPSAARLAYYESVAPSLREAVDELLRTRGLTSIFLVSVDGHVVTYQARDAVGPEQMGPLVVQVQQCVQDFSSELTYWALECEGGIVLLQQLDERHALVAVGQAGSSFAMIRLNLDKAKSKLAEPLTGAPHD